MKLDEPVVEISGLGGVKSVELYVSGLIPPTPPYKKEQTVKRPSVLFGGDKRDRTADLLNAIQALSQLSYTPICCSEQAL